MSSSPPRQSLLQLANQRRMSEDEYAQLLAWLTRKRSLARRTTELDKELLDDYAETVSDSRFIEPQATPPDCQQCGACCSYFHQIPVQIQDATPRALTWQVYESDEVDEMPLYWLRRRLEDGNCVALAGSVGDRANCLIYELRPLACRAFEAGSDRCHALRRVYGLEPELSVLEKQSHRQILRAQVEAPETEKVLGLGELIDYNLGKLAEIASEIERLAILFADFKESQGAMLCEQSGREIDDNRRAIVDTLAPLVTTSVDSERSFFELLQIGNFSQESVETAAKQLAQVGGLVFEITGMKRAVENRLADLL